MKLRGGGRRTDRTRWLVLGLVVLMGVASAGLRSETFIQWTPSVLYWASGLGLWISRVVFRRNLLHALIGHQIALPATAWQRLNFAWVAFFGLMGLLSLWVTYSFDAETWVNFQLFGGIGLLLLFMLAQGLCVSRCLRSEALDAEPPGPFRP